MKTKLFVLIDFSPYSTSLVKMAVKWAKKMDAEIALVHQVHGFVPALASSNSKNMLIEQEKGSAQAQLSTLITEHIPISIFVSIHVTDRQLLPFIQSLMLPSCKNLLFMGLKGSGVLKQLFIGSTVISMIESANVPVLAMPIIEDIEIPKKLIVALSYKYPINEDSLRSLVESLSGHLEHIDFITVIKPEDTNALALDYLDILAKKFTVFCSSKYYFYSGDHALSEIKAFVGQQPDAVLVVQKGARTLKDKVFRKFIINELVYEGSLPMIVLPEQEA
jgi:nucleotide-binding universal stress UspA family protein